MNLQIGCALQDAALEVCCPKIGYETIYIRVHRLWIRFSWRQHWTLRAVTRKKDVKILHRHSYPQLFEQVFLVNKDPRSYWWHLIEKNQSISRLQESIHSIFLFNQLWPSLGATMCSDSGLHRHAWINADLHSIHWSALLVRSKQESCQEGHYGAWVFLPHISPALDATVTRTTNRVL